MILVTGASASGKSEYAEQLVVQGGVAKRLYLATMQVWDEEGKARVSRHRRKRRTKQFETIEQGANLAAIGKEVFAGKDVLLECMSNLAANELFSVGGSEAEIRARILTGIRRLEEGAASLVVVTNEVFSDDGDYSGETKAYLQLLGLVNQDLAMLADTVIEVVYGIPVWIK